MYCTNCGSEINDQAVICPNCGVATSNYQSLEKSSNKNGMAIAGFVCAFFIPLLGWIFGGIGLSNANKNNGKNKGFALGAIAVASVVFIINFILILTA